MDKVRKGDVFATAVFTLLVGFIGLGILGLIIWSPNGSLKDSLNLKSLLFSIFFFLLFFGYALGGSKLAAKLLGKSGKEKDDN